MAPGEYGRFVSQFPLRGHPGKLERYTSSSADEFPLKEKPTYHEQLKSLLKPICEALTALGVCEVVAAVFRVWRRG